MFMDVNLKKPAEDKVSDQLIIEQINQINHIYEYLLRKVPKHHIIAPDSYISWKLSTFYFQILIIVKFSLGKKIKKLDYLKIHNKFCTAF